MNTPLDEPIKDSSKDCIIYCSEDFYEKLLQHRSMKPFSHRKWLMDTYSVPHKNMQPFALRTWLKETYNVPH